MLLQLSFVALAEADALEDRYAYPARRMTPEEEREWGRLRAVSQRLAYRAAEKGVAGGSDEAFGEEVEVA